MKHYGELSKAKYQRHHVEERKRLNRLIHEYMRLRTRQRVTHLRYIASGDVSYRDEYDDITEQMNDVHLDILRLNELIYGLKTPLSMLTEQGKREELEFRERMYELGIMKRVRCGRPTGYHHDEETKRRIGEGKRRAAMLKNIKDD